MDERFEVEEKLRSMSRVELAEFAQWLVVRRWPPTYYIDGLPKWVPTHGAYSHWYARQGESAYVFAGTIATACGKFQPANVAIETAKLYATYVSYADQLAWLLA